VTGSFAGSDDLDVGTADDHCTLYFDLDEDVVDHVLIERPTAATWMWEAVFDLMSDYDFFLYWPADDLIAAMARPEVPLPDDMPAKRVVVASAGELARLVEDS
jgi:hypothetical protein